MKLSKPLYKNAVIPTDSAPDKLAGLSSAKAISFAFTPERLISSVKIVSDYIKSNAKDASSIEFLEWSKVISIGKNWTVRCKYKGTNSLGGIVTENAWFYIQNSKVVDSKSI